jgi:hypothetical protein
LLRVPDRGVRVSSEKHNNNLLVLCDWVELSVLVLDDELSRVDVIDVLREQYRYTSQDLAAERVGSLWSELRRRRDVVGAGSPVAIEDGFLIRTADWPIAAAYTFCLVSSLAPFYGDWFKEFGPDYTVQGELFERIAAAALPSLMRGWDVQLTGWSRDHAAQLAQVAPALAEALGEEMNPDFATYAGESAHEAGLDLATYRTFRDGRGGGKPVYLVQCATGENWWEKLHTPELAVWNKIIHFVHAPAKAFATPFQIEDGEFVRRGVQVNGLLLDRLRLLSMGVPEAEWLDEVLREELVGWLKARVDWLSAEAVAS